MVEYEDRRARFPQVVFAAHLEIQIDQGAGGVCEQGNREIGRLAPRTRERVDWQARRKDRHQADGGGHGANELSRRGTAAAGEADGRPVPVAGQGAQLIARVERDGMADALQEQPIVGAVGVEKALAQFGAEGVGEGLRGIHLALAKTGGSRDMAGEASVLHFEARTQDRVDAQIGGGRFDLVRRGRGDDGQRMTFGPMRFDQRPGFGVDPACDLLPEQRFAQRHVGLLLDASKELGRDGHHGGETQLAQAEMGQRRGKFYKIARGQVAAPQLFANKWDGGIA